jgi:hypothetical protein
MATAATNHKKTPAPMPSPYANPVAISVTVSGTCDRLRGCATSIACHCGMNDAITPSTIGAVRRHIQEDTHRTHHPLSRKQVAVGSFDCLLWLRMWLRSG